MFRDDCASNSLGIEFLFACFAKRFACEHFWFVEFNNEFSAVCVDL